MDPQKDGNWTNEKHQLFLRSMEAHFVRTVLKPSGRIFRLDRYVPDISESTQDLKSLRRGKISGAAAEVSFPTTRTSSQRIRSIIDPCHVTKDQDQVVPQVEGINGKAEND
ncbi:hypothetical protein Nepgr_031406 [Nepenthes gracilis]|uniref:Uncharacterized protein n=1 Tax=Nepenthes gracilis TaxID=150966 RepID=A0AAD3Y545_NEPGR|nr:hypothetical protein Nepgr_031406 [Nepenthes gracilis]